MIINKETLLTLIQEQVDKECRKKALVKQIAELEQQVQDLDNSSVLLREFQNPLNMMQTPQKETLKCLGLRILPQLFLCSTARELEKLT